MQFEFERNRYRIVFSYDKDRNWAAHQQHAVKLHQEGSKGQPALWCLHCNLQLSHLPKAQRKRLVRCTLFVHNAGAWESMASGVGRVNLKAGDRFSRKEGREAALTDMLETFTKLRIAAVQNDLVAAPFRKHVAISARTFRLVAWTAYNERKKAGPFRKDAAGQSGP